MLKLVLFGVLGFVVLSSCKREFTCNCTFSSGGSLKIKYVGEKKKDAQDHCAAAEEKYKQGDASTVCVLE